ncbi:uncharacterized protein SRS1_12682 [Sporisorium reilianum f. sp. reilianum]|uniref:Uncharacterized protein n=1 Tax=Sporisorium reilianum f. sp. reilianum TaxID=72559 RepID=A0A2N8UAE8_9BASI|nr:uncharacterized protein SRS1_12682 [Sporisorium reilianum f. sp. reilianum]
MSDKTDTVTLVIDTSRQRPPLLNTPLKLSASDLQTPDTSSTSTTVLWSASASATTPTTALTTACTYDHAFAARRSPDTASATHNSEWLISKIDEYLADLSSSLPRPASKAVRRSLKLDLDPVRLLSVERALPSSPDAVRPAHLAIPPLLLSSGSGSGSSGKSCPTSMPSSPIDFDDDLCSSLFYRCFSRPGCAVSEDAAPFPYSPCRESVCLEPGYFAGGLLGRVSGAADGGWRRTSVVDVLMEREESGVGLPSIRLEAANEVDEEDEGGANSAPVSAESSACSSPEREQVYWSEEEPRSAEDSPASTHIAASKSLDVPAPSTDAQLFTPSTPEGKSLHVPTRTLLPPPAIPPRRRLSRSASAGNLTRMSTQAARNLTPATSPERLDLLCTPTRSNTEPPKTPSPPSSKRAVEVSPTSTQIVTGVRKMNKLKQLLGEEVSPHISRALIANTRDAKPLPCLPSRALQRSHTTFSANTAVLGSHKPRDKKCCAATGGSTGRPATARDRCNCASCAARADLSKSALKMALTGTSLKLPPPRPERVGLGARPSTSGSMRRAKASFLDISD